MRLLWRLLAVLLLASLSVGCRPPLVVGPLPVVESQVVPEPATEVDLQPRSKPGEFPRMLPVAARSVRPISLEHTEVTARAIGRTARVRTRQRFANLEDRTVEAEYRFGLPEHAELDSLRIVIGERTIESVVQLSAAEPSGAEREPADVLSYSIAEIPARGHVEVELSYVQTLTQEQGELELVFPLVLGNGERRNGAVTFNLEVEAGARIEQWDAPTQAITASPTELGFSARLAAAESLPNRDLLVRWRVAPARAQAMLHLGPADTDGRGHFSLLVLPPVLGPDHEQPRELIFVIDSSTTMSEWPLRHAEGLVREGLSRLRPNDSFNVVTFRGSSTRLFARSQPVGKATVAAAKRMVGQLPTDSGAHMHEALEVLRAEIGAEQRRFVVFVSDGTLGDERMLVEATADLIARAESVGARAHVFAVGVGSDIELAPLRRLAKAGNGEALTWLGTDLWNHDDDAPTVGSVVSRIFRYIERPIVEEVAVDWAGLEVERVFPTELSDLIAGEAIGSIGRYRGRLSGEPIIRGRVPGHAGLVEIPVHVVQGDDRILATMWARAQLDDIARLWNEGGLQPEATRELIRSIGTELQVVTQLTRLVAVDSRVGAGEPVILAEMEDQLDLDTYWPRHNLAVYRTVCFAGSKPVYVWVHEDEHPAAVLPLGNADWGPDSVMRITSLASSAGVDLRAIRSALRDRAAQLEACHETHRSKARKRSLRYRLHFDGDRLLAVELLEGSFGEAGERCLDAVFHRAPWRGLPAERAVVEVGLQLRLR